MNILKLIAFFVLASTLIGCSSSNVVSDNWIQKRKHTEGFYVNILKTKSNQKSLVEESLDHQKNDIPIIADVKIKESQLSKDVNFVLTDDEIVREHEKNDSKLTIADIKNKHIAALGNSTSIKDVMVNQKELKNNTKIYLNLSEISDEEDKVEKTPASALVGFIVSLAGLFLLPFICGVVGTIFSAIALNKILKEGRKGKGFAITGLVVGIISILWGLIIIAAAV